jgi:hypothetical protein
VWYGSVPAGGLTRGNKNKKTLARPNMETGISVDGVAAGMLMVPAVKCDE